MKNATMTRAENAVRKLHANPAPVAQRKCLFAEYAYQRAAAKVDPRGPWGRWAAETRAKLG